ncbi:hypothetical protein NDU88_003280 [Pleurodeles waltl]|uniref:Uncharacterized protein n=1 Tax=Pleurodeles waltl TaxID=8319 RepID=A0AAV7UY00_PLEWA|nr:hypothetical protein NDU88_003280 [Pleurodeles waltl]
MTGGTRVKSGQRHQSSLVEQILCRAHHYHVTLMGPTVNLRTPGPADLIGWVPTGTLSASAAPVPSPTTRSTHQAKLHLRSTGAQAPECPSMCDRSLGTSRPPPSAPGHASSWQPRQR